MKIIPLLKSSVVALFLIIGRGYAQKKPNLVFVFPDQMRLHSLGFMNQDPVLTPRLDRFVRNSQYFTNAISNVPICSPYRSMLMTGRYPISTGVIANLFTTDNHGLPTDVTSFGEALQHAGYKTGYIGKWHLSNPEALPPRKNDEQYIEKGELLPGPAGYGFEYVLQIISMHKNKNPEYWENSKTKISREWSVDLETDKAINFIKEKKDEPFALFISYGPPHSPYVVPQKYIDSYRGKAIPLRPNNTMTVSREERVKYFAGVTWCDDNFGRLLDVINDQGLDDNTIVIFTSDHGQMLGSHGENDEKTYWYEEALKVPFLIRWPEKIPPGKNEMLLSAYDLMPTILGLMGAEIPSTVEGKNWSKNILTRNSKGPSAALIAHYSYVAGYETTAYIDGLKRHVVFDQGFTRKVSGYGNLQQVGFRGVTDGKYTYVFDKCPADEPTISFNWREWNSSIKYQNKGKIRTTEFLHDNLKDPYQLMNIPANSAKYLGEVSRLRKELKNWLKEVHDPFELNNRVN